jgi:hypothetical protein
VWSATPAVFAFHFTYGPPGSGGRLLDLRPTHQDESFPVFSASSPSLPPILVRVVVGRPLNGVLVTCQVVSVRVLPRGLWWARRPGRSVAVNHRPCIVASTECVLDADTSNSVHFTYGPPRLSCVLDADTSNSVHFTYGPPRLSCVLDADTSNSVHFTYGPPRQWHGSTVCGAGTVHFTYGLLARRSSVASATYSSHMVSREPRRQLMLFQFTYGPSAGVDTNIVWRKTCIQ